VTVSDMTASEYLQRSQAYDVDHPDEAIAACNEAIRLDPLCAEAYVERGKRFYRKDQVEDALTDFTEAIHINPDYLEAYLERADLWDMGMGFHERGIADYTQAIRIDPQSWDAVQGYRIKTAIGDTTRNHPPKRRGSVSA
jgi:tetratricopeptide (TPR) repeat protein